MPRDAGPLRTCRYTATREFVRADGRPLRVHVVAIRTTEGGPVVVGSQIATPRGQAYRYHQHVEPLAVWRACRDWLDALPADYCLEAECADQRADHWQRLIHDYLLRVPCIETPAE